MESLVFCKLLYDRAPLVKMSLVRVNPLFIKRYTVTPSARMGNRLGLIGIIPGITRLLLLLTIMNVSLSKCHSASKLIRSSSARISTGVGITVNWLILNFKSATADGYDENTTFMCTTINVLPVGGGVVVNVRVVLLLYVKFVVFTNRWPFR